MSICLTSQVGAVPISGIIDFNGLKGPNVVGRDLRTFTLDLQFRNTRNTSSEGIKDTKMQRYFVEV